jgi:hypothetical protein
VISSGCRWEQVDLENGTIAACAGNAWICVFRGITAAASLKLVLLAADHQAQRILKTILS